jgi:hypothetical protein
MTDPLDEIKALVVEAFAEPTTGEQREAWMRWLHRTREVMPWLIGEVERLRAKELDTDMLVGAMQRSRVELEQARRKVERLRGLQGRLEWIRRQDDYYDGCCPVCDKHELDGHAPGCWLAAELAPDPPEGSQP